MATAADTTAGEEPPRPFSRLTTAELAALVGADKLEGLDDCPRNDDGTWDALVVVAYVCKWLSQEHGK